MDRHHNKADSAAIRADHRSTSVAASLIIPAYNEAARLPVYLAAARAYYADEFADDYEIVVVDDGSSDGLSAMLNDAASDWPQLRTLRHASNRGKGAAVRSGMLEARGQLLLFADADGATPIAEERRLRTAIEQGADVAVGSRLLRSAKVVRQRTLRRALVGRAFALAAGTLLRLPVRDTQCGFKMFRREAGQRLFRLVEEERYLFDLELLMLAGALGCRVAEVPVNWADQRGSQLSLAREFAKIGAGLWRLRRRQAALRRSPPAV